LNLTVLNEGIGKREGVDGMFEILLVKGLNITSNGEIRIS